MGFLHNLMGTSMNNIIFCNFLYQFSRTLLLCLLGLRDIRQLFRDISDRPPLDYWLLPPLCPMYSTVQGGVTEQSLSLVNYFDIQYLGMCLLFLHIRKKDDLKLGINDKIVMIVFAPFMQMTFLASFIYFWSKGDKGKKVEIIFIRLFLRIDL